MSKKVLFTAITGLILITVLFLTACAPAQEVAPAEEAQVEEAATEKSLFIGLSMHNQSETWAVQFANSFKETAEAGGATVSMTDANANSSTQISQMEDLVALGVDVLVFLPTDSEALGNVIRDAYEAGVILVNADTMVNEADHDMITAFITADCYTGGYTAGEYLAELLEPNAIVGEINYPNLKVIDVRFDGMEDALHDKGRDDVVFVEKVVTDTSAIATYTEDMLMANPDISAFLCLNDSCALACYSTCKELGHPEIMVIGFDGQPAAKQSIAAGEITATIVYSPIDMGKTSAETALAILKGEPYEKNIIVNMWIINSDNIETYDLNAWN